MSTISNGNRMRLPAGQVLTLKGGAGTSADITIQKDGRTITGAQLGELAVASYGPFATDCDVIVAPTRGTVDAVIDWRLKPTPQPETLKTAVVFGDSLTERFSTTAGVNNYTRQTSYLVWALAQNRWPVRVVKNAGISGNTTTQMLMRIKTDVLDYNPDIVFFLGGINDAANAFTPAQTISNISAIVGALTARGIAVVISTVWPTAVINTDVRRNWLYTVNEYIRSLAKSSDLVLLADIHDVLTNNAGTYGTNTMLDESGQWLHPTAYGAQLAGSALTNAMNSLFPSQSQRSGVTGAEYNNMIINGAMIGNNAAGAGGFTVGTGITGNGPNGWGITRSGAAIVATCAKAARTDKPTQEWFRVTIGTGGADNERLILSKGVFFRTWASFATADFVRRFYVPATGCQYEVIVAGNLAGTDDTATWPTTIGAQFATNTATLRCVEPFRAGDTVRLFAEFQLSGLAVSKITPWASVSFRDPSNVVQISAYAGYFDFATDGEAPSIAASSPLLFCSPEIVIPATFDLSVTTGSTGPNLYVEANFLTKGGATGVCDFGPLVLQRI